MKKTVEVKYPNSASLFQFCRKVLDHKFGGIRVIDQDVGQILGFDPADCSHWKKGKKNIRSIQAMKSIAEHLGVDEKLVVDIASGEVDEFEGYQEFRGYGAFAIDPKVFEVAKKDFYLKNASTWTREKEMAFKEKFDANEPAITKLVSEIHAKINFSEAPLYLPEVAAAYPQLRLAPVDSKEQDADTDPDWVDSAKTAEKTEIKYVAGREVRPFMRFRIAKKIGEHFLAQSGLHTTSDLGEHVEHIADIQSNIFAARLLTPEILVRKEMQQISVSKDIVSQLSEVFWVSKSFMNARLKEILQD